MQLTRLGQMFWSPPIIYVDELKVGWTLSRSTSLVYMLLWQQEDQDRGETQIEAWDMKLWLPSQLCMADKSCDRSIMEYEWELRVAQANGSTRWDVKEDHFADLRYEAQGQVHTGYSIKEPSPRNY